MKKQSVKRWNRGDGKYYFSRFQKPSPLSVQSKTTEKEALHPKTFCPFKEGDTVRVHNDCNTYIFKGILKGDEYKKDPRVCLWVNGIHDISKSLSELIRYTEPVVEAPKFKPIKVTKETAALVGLDYDCTTNEIFMKDKVTFLKHVYKDDTLDTIIPDMIKRAYEKGLIEGRFKEKQELREAGNKIMSLFSIGVGLPFPRGW